MLHKILETYRVESPEQAVALLNPLRAEILTRLSEPASASEVARALNEPPQRINYHLKALEKVGLAKRVGTRQVRNLVEVLFQAIAKTFILSDSLGWNADTVQQLKDHQSLSHLISLADRLKRDVFSLMENSDPENPIPSASLMVTVPLKSEQARNAFLKEYVDSVKALAAKYQAMAAQNNCLTQNESEAFASGNSAASSTGNTYEYQVLLAIYPDLTKG